MHICTCVPVCMYANEPHLIPTRPKVYGKCLMVSDGGLQRDTIRSNSEAKLAGSKVRTHPPATGDVISREC